MKINFVYDVLGPTQPIDNGFIPKYYNYFWDSSMNLFDDKSNTSLQRETTIKYFGAGILTNLDYSVKCISDIDGTEKEINLIPISTSGDYYSSLGIDLNNNRKYLKGKSVFNFLSETMKSKLNSIKNLYIFYEHQGEPYFDTELIDYIYKEVTNNAIRISKVLIVNGCNSNNFLLKQYQEHYSNFKNIRLIDFTWAIPFKALEIRSKLGLRKFHSVNNTTICNINHLTLNKEKKALFLNRRLRYHRLCLLSYMEVDNLLDNTLHSFDMSLNLYPNIVDIIDSKINGKDTVGLPFDFKDIHEFKKLKDGITSLNRKNKMILDYDNLHEVHGYGMETKELYEKTFFSIVTETEYSQHQQSITEKIIKPIMHCHPFIVFGSPNSLKTLKKYGFKTFDKWWDESYDNEIDDYDRFYKFYNILNLLLNKSHDEWILLINEMKEILEYNQKLLISMDENYFIKEFSKNLEDIIYNNKKTLF